MTTIKLKQRPTSLMRAVYEHYSIVVNLMSSVWLLLFASRNHIFKSLRQYTLRFADVARTTLQLILYMTCVLSLLYLILSLNGKSLSIVLGFWKATLKSTLGKLLVTRIDNFTLNSSHLLLTYGSKMNRFTGFSFGTLSP